MGYWYSTISSPENVHLEEQNHITQIEALGPLLLLAYVMGPEFIEPYDRNLRYNFTVYRCMVPHCMWSPPKEIERQFPQFRVTFGEEATRLEFLPGYAPLISSLTSWLIN